MDTLDVELGPRRYPIHIGAGLLQRADLLDAVRARPLRLITDEHVAAHYLREMQRTLAALGPYVKRGVPVIGLEPSCLLSFRDELPSLIKGEAVDALAAQAMLLEEFLAREQKEGRLNLPLGSLPKKALLHGHCHQKAFDAMGAVESVLRLVPKLEVQTVESSCCGMAGSFGYDAETIDVSLKMGELSLLPAVRKAPADALIVADGTSCRHQIHDGTDRDALHVARVLAMSVAAGGA